MGGEGVRRERACSNRRAATTACAEATPFFTVVAPFSAPPLTVFAVTSQPCLTAVAVAFAGTSTPAARISKPRDVRRRRGEEVGASPSRGDGGCCASSGLSGAGGEITHSAEEGAAANTLINERMARCLGYVKLGALHAVNSRLAEAGW